MYCIKPTINNLSFLDFPLNEECVTIMFTGCSNNCYNCQNKELQKHGLVYDNVARNKMLNIIQMLCDRNNTRNVTFQGGDPFDNQNKDDAYWLSNKLKNNGYHVCVYTGLTIDKVKKLKYLYDNKVVKFNFNAFDFIKCGKYDETKKVLSKKTDDYIQFASMNQELYNKNGELISTNGRYEYGSNDK